MRQRNTQEHENHQASKSCGKKHRAGLPEGVTLDLLTPRAKVIVATLTDLLRNSKRTVKKLLKDLFNLDISLGTVSNIERRVNDKCEKAYDATTVNAYYLFSFN